MAGDLPFCGRRILDVPENQSCTGAVGINGFQRGATSRGQSQDDQGQ